MAERKVLAAVGLLALAAFALVAWQVAAQGPLTAFDHTALRWMVAHRAAAITRFMLAISEVHKTLPVLGMAALLAWWELSRRGRLQAVLVLLLVPGGMLLNVAMKHLFQRARPAGDEALVRIATFSFPSGHVAAATLFYAALAALVFAHTRSRAMRGMAVGWCALMVSCVAVSRVYLGAHYVSDTLGAFLLASAWVCAVRWALAPTLRISAGPQ